MRLWSIHPKYLDSKGLVALWRESLLAKKVLSGKTKGYKNHPQLERFKAQKDPIKAINAYLATICEESCKRHYCFDKSKVGFKSKTKIKVTKGQVEYEFKHLKNKLKKRDPKKYKELTKTKRISANSIFSVKKGPIEAWEKQ
jgi:hypothetical protein